MKLRPRTLTLLAAGALLLVAAPDYTAEGRRWWSHIEKLADDSMEGRNTGSPGHRRAAEFVSQEFERSGLRAAGTTGYIQPVKFGVRQIDESQSSLAIVRNGRAEPLTLGKEATLGVRISRPESVEAQAVFVGHGLVIPEYKYNDLAGLDLKGKIAVILRGGPPEIPGQIRSHYSSGKEQWKALRAAGVIGIVSIANPKSMDIPWERASLARLQPSMALAEAGADENQGLKVSVTFNPAEAERLFTGSGHTFAELLKLADAKQPLPKFPLPISIRARTAFQSSEVESQNVAGVRKGTDLQGEYVTLSAHLDHLGIGEPINGDKIYNGAMDDASGIATLIEVSRILNESNAKLRRSALFVAVTGEEKGLQGSKHFSLHPTVPPGSIVADINLDMFLPLFDLKYLEVQGATESTLGDAIRAVAAQYGVEIQNDKEPDRNLFIRSDQYSFIQRGIPSLAFKFGYVPGTPEEKIFKDWYKQRYHAPSDDLSQPVNKDAAAKFNRIIVSLIERIANTPERPHWNENSFFQRFTKATE